jgi:4-hydroxy-tetrahydrodipicolinate synthase
MVDGAVGWFAGFPNVFPAESVHLYDLMAADSYAEARALYEKLVTVFRWDSRTEFVQAIKLGMDMVGRFGGPCRPPRGPLTAEHAQQVRAETLRAIDSLSPVA